MLHSYNMNKICVIFSLCQHFNDLNLLHGIQWRWKAQILHKYQYDISSWYYQYMVNLYDFAPISLVSVHNSSVKRLDHNVTTGLKWNMETIPKWDDYLIVKFNNRLSLLLQNGLTVFLCHLHDKSLKLYVWLDII